MLQYCVLMSLSGRFQSINSVTSKKINFSALLFILALFLSLFCSPCALLWLYLVVRVLNKHVNTYVSEELNRCYFIIIIVCFAVNMIR